MNCIVEEKKIIFNVSLGLDNYSQRNNIYVLQKKNNIVNYANVCNTTSICMAASYAGWIFPKKPFEKYSQPEDRLTAFCLEDKRVSDFYKKNFPILWREWQDDVTGAIPPNQVHAVLEYATNLWFGQQVVCFSTDREVRLIIDQILLGLPVVISGVFPSSSDSSKTINHIAVLVGLVYNKSDYLLARLDNPGYKLLSINNQNTIPFIPTHLIFDDPWGNFVEGYEKRLTGNDVVCEYNKALSYLKPLNNSAVKWGYTLTKGAEIV